MKLDPNFINLYMHKINKKVMSGRQEILERHGLNKRHFMYIFTLYKHDSGFTLVELTNHLGVDKSHTTRTISELINKKFIEKQYQEGLKFKFKVVLTEEGKKIGNDLIKYNNLINKVIMSKLSEEDLIQLERIFKKITEDM